MRKVIGLTPEELAAIDALSYAATLLHDLPEAHPADWAESVVDIHNLQNRIMARAAIRAHPGTFRHAKGFERFDTVLDHE